MRTFLLGSVGFRGLGFRVYNTGSVLEASGGDGLYGIPGFRVTGRRLGCSARLSVLGSLLFSELPISV